MLLPCQRFTHACTQKCCRIVASDDKDGTTDSLSIRGITSKSSCALPPIEGIPQQWPPGCDHDSRCADAPAPFPSRIETQILYARCLQNDFAQRTPHLQQLASTRHHPTNCSREILFSSLDPSLACRVGIGENPLQNPADDDMRQIFANILLINFTPNLA